MTRPHEEVFGTESEPETSEPETAASVPEPNPTPVVVNTYQVTHWAHNTDNESAKSRCVTELMNAEQAIRFIETHTL